MRTIYLLVVHCSATHENRDFTEYDLDICHRRCGFNGPGYHFFILPSQHRSLIATYGEDRNYAFKKFVFYKGKPLLFKYAT